MLDAASPSERAVVDQAIGDRRPDRMDMTVFGRAAAASSVEGAELALLGGFEFRVSGRPIALPLGAQRVIAFLALHERQVQRSFVAGSLWSDAPSERAAASLRSALWRIRGQWRGAIAASNGALGLHDVAVDVNRLRALSRRLEDRPLAELGGLIARFEADLLPDWYDDWAMDWRERWRQIRLHSLETVMRILASAGCYAEAIDAGLAAVRTEPLRESAHRGLIETHLLEGNLEEARRQFHAYEQLLHDELGIRPSPRMIALLGRVTHP